MKVACQIIEDLIPLVIDGIASEESKQLVLQHINECEACAALYDEMSQPSLNKMEKETILKKLKRTMLIKEVVVLLIGIGIVNFMIGKGYLLFMNILILPVIGMLSYFILKQKWYYALAGVAVFMCIYSITSALLVPYHYFSELFYIIPALILTLLGVAIGALLYYAFAKEERYHEKKK